MNDLINFLMTYLNPIYWMNLLWDFLLDAIYLFLQLVLDTLVLILSAVNWLCPVFPNLSPPTEITVGSSSLSFATLLSWVSWVIPWHYAFQMITVMIGCTMFAVMTTWVLRWMKVVR